MSYRNFNLLFIGPSEEFTKIEWTYDHHFKDQAPVNFFYTSLNKISTVNLREYDLCVLLLDLHQPVPVDSLFALQGLSGVACFTQPTPRQLMDLFKMDNFKPLIWTGNDYEQLVTELINHCQSNQQKFKQQQFLSFAKDWLDRKRVSVAEIRIANVPASWKGSETLSLDPSKGYYLLGALNAKCDFNLPLAGDQSLAELSFAEGFWQVYIFGESSGPKRLVVGDEFFLGETILKACATSEIAELSSFAQNAGVLAVAKETPEEFEGSLYKYCQKLLLKQLRGSLRVSSHEGQGQLDFFDGVIVGAYAGVAKNAKAFFRILSWEQGLQVSFQPEEDIKIAQDLHINLQEFMALVPKWHAKRQTLKQQQPPLDLVLNLDRDAFLAKQDWRATEFLVACVIGQHQLVRDVINFCSLNDLEIIEELIHLRQQRVIHPVG